jgi:hypothetical protein
MSQKCCAGQRGANLNKQPIDKAKKLGAFIGGINLRINRGKFPDARYSDLLK